MNRRVTLILVLSAFALALAPWTLGSGEWGARAKVGPDVEIRDILEGELSTDPLNPDTDGDPIPNGQDAEWLQNAMAAVPDDALTDPRSHGLRTAALTILDNVEKAVAQDHIDGAVRKLHNLRRHLDGCGSAPERDDWIVHCPAQIRIREFVDLLTANLAKVGADVGIDVDPSAAPANTASSLGSVETCVRVSPGDTFDIDVFLDGIPHGRGLSDFEYDLNFDSTRLEITAQDHSLLMAAAGGGVLADLSEDVPDVDGSHAVIVVDSGTAETNPPYTQGVLGRYTLHALPDLLPGLANITLVSVNVTDDAGGVPVATVAGAIVAVDVICPFLPSPRDTDQDGLDNVLEHEFGTDPRNPDTDGDGILDGQDVEWLQNAIAAVPDDAFKNSASRGLRAAMPSILDVLL